MFVILFTILIVAGVFIWFCQKHLLGFWFAAAVLLLMALGIMQFILGFSLVPTILALIIITLLIFGKRKALEEDTVAKTNYLKALGCIGFAIFQFFFFFVALMGTKGDILMALLPVWVGGGIWLIRKDWRVKWVGIVCWVAVLIAFLPDGFFTFGRMSFTQMPTQRYVSLTEATDSTPARRYVSESVLIQNPPPLGSKALRSVMLDYFDDANHYYKDSGRVEHYIRFYKNTRSTRVFVDNVEDPYSFATIRLYDKYDEQLGEVWVKPSDINPDRQLKYVQYRDVGDSMVTDTITG